MFSLHQDNDTSSRPSKLLKVEVVPPIELKKQTERFFEALMKKQISFLNEAFCEDCELEDIDEVTIEGRESVCEYFEKALSSWKSVVIYYQDDQLIVHNLQVTVTLNYSFGDVNFRRYHTKAVFKFLYNANKCIANLKVFYDKSNLLEQLQSQKIKIPVAIVTGSASNLGAAIAKKFFRDGMHIVVADINEEKGKKTADSLQGIFVKVDVSDGGSMETLINSMYQKFGRLDCLVNNAGITGPRSPIVGYPDDGWHKVLRVDLDSVYYGMKYALRVMQKQGWGVIINMSSISGIIGYENVAAYTSAKAAIIGLTRSTSLEAARYGIRVNAICPTGVLTESVEQLIFSSPNPQIVEKQFSSYNPLPGSPRPIDIANAASFLASDASKYITGITLLVDAGYTAK